MEDSPGFRVQVKYPHSVYFFWIWTTSRKFVQIYFFLASARAQTVWKKNTLLFFRNCCMLFKPIDILIAICSYSRGANKTECRLFTFLLDNKKVTSIFCSTSGHIFSLFFLSFFYPHFLPQCLPSAVGNKNEKNHLVRHGDKNTFFWQSKRY